MFQEEEVETVDHAQGVKLFKTKGRSQDVSLLRSLIKAMPKSSSISIGKLSFVFFFPCEYKHRESHLSPFPARSSPIILLSPRRAAFCISSVRFFFCFFFNRMYCAHGNFESLDFHESGVKKKEPKNSKTLSEELIGKSIFFPSKTAFCPDFTTSIFLKNDHYISPDLNIS